MKEPDIVQLAKEAYVLSQQLFNLETAMAKEQAVSGYASYATNYNEILGKSKKILKIDGVLHSTIAHLRSYDAHKEMGYLKDFEEIKADIAILKATLLTFFEFHFPKQEKDRIGFRSMEEQK